LVFLLCSALAACQKPPHTNPDSAAHESPPGPSLEYIELVRGAERPSLPLIIAVHGMGDRPEHFQEVFGDYPGEARFILPRAPTPQGDGASWFPTRIGALEQPDLIPGMEKAADQLASLAADLKKRYPAAPAPIVTGFSQGGMLSFLLATRHPGAIRRAVPVAGWLPPGLQGAKAPTPAPSIRALHGDADNILPLGPTQEAVTALKGAGWDVTLEVFPGVGHRIPAPLRARWFELLSE
jgi:phospholipase/carboxylesterase